MFIASEKRAAPEQEIASENREVLNRILAFRPWPPVGKVPIKESWLARARDSAKAPIESWAYVTLPTWVAKIADTYGNVSADELVYLDLCSSKPSHTQRLRAHEFDRSGERARELVRGMFAEQTLGNLPEDLRPVAKAVAKNKHCRGLLISGVQDILYGITPEEWHSHTNGSGDEFRIRLANALAERDKVVEQPGKRNEKGFASEDEIADDTEIRLGLRFDEVGEDSGPNYYSATSSLKIPSRLAEFAGLIFKLGSAQPKEDAKLAKDRVEAGPELAARYITWQSNYLAGIIAGNKRYRPFRAVSMDIAPVDDLAVSAIINTPEDERGMNLDSHAIASLGNPNLHLTGSILEPLQFPDNSLAFITCFDGWPNHFQMESGQPWSAEAFEETAFGVLSELYRKLAYGGKIVIFPWDIAGTNATKKESLNNVRKRLQHELDIVTGIESMSRRTLQRSMSDGDLEIAHTKSTITKYDMDKYGDYPALIILKPKESSINSRGRVRRRPNWDN